MFRLDMIYTVVLEALMFANQELGGVKCEEVFVTNTKMKMRGSLLSPDAACLYQKPKVLEGERHSRVFSQVMDLAQVKGLFWSRLG